MSVSLKWLLARFAKDLAELGLTASIDVYTQLDPWNIIGECDDLKLHMRQKTDACVVYDTAVLQFENRRTPGGIGYITDVRVNGPDRKATLSDLATIFKVSG